MSESTFLYQRRRVYCAWLTSRVPPVAEARNAFKKWHVAFHGTGPQNVRKILDTGGLVLPG